MRTLLLEQTAPPSIAAAVSFLMIGLDVTSIQGQELKQTSAINKTVPSVTSRSNDSSRSPKFTEYKGVRIGMSADELVRNLETLRIKNKTQDLYVFSEN